MTLPENTFMYQEAASATLVAERQLAHNGNAVRELGERLRTLNPQLVVTCGRGSSDHASTYAKYLIETRARTPVCSYAPSVSSLYATPWRKLEGALFLVISQSGQSPDILLSAQAAKDSGALVVAIVNAADSPLAGIAEVTIPMHAGPERSVAATKSFLASMLAILGIAAAWTNDSDMQAELAQAPSVLRQAWELDWSAAVPVLRGTTSLFILGRGLTLAAAQEAALKLKETCGLHAEAYSAAEVKHGPMAIVGPDVPVIILAGSDGQPEIFDMLARDFVDRGASVIVAGRTIQQALTLPFLPGLPPSLAPLALVQSFYKLAATLSVGRGFDPDHPPHLSKVTATR